MQNIAACIVSMNWEKYTKIHISFMMKIVFDPKITLRIIIGTYMTGIKQDPYHNNQKKIYY